MGEFKCAHCERLATLDEMGLCPTCRVVDQVRVLYVRRRGWTPAWEEHLRRLRLRANAGLPLFDDSCRE